MSERDLILLEDIVEAIAKIEIYIKQQNYESFCNNDMCVDAVVRNLEIIGEAAKSVSSETKSQLNCIDWKGMAGMRDRLIHAYRSVDSLIVWQTASEKLPSIRLSILEKFPALSG